MGGESLVFLRLKHEVCSKIIVVIATMGMFYASLLNI